MHKQNILVFALLALLLALNLGVAIKSALVAPVFGWDVLDYWAPSVAYSFQAKHDLMVGEAANNFLYKHPRFISDVHALVISLGVKNPFPFLIIAFLSAFFSVAYFFLFTCERKPVLFLCFCYAIVSTPLIGNHITSPGYMDVPIALFYGIATMATIRLLESKRRYFRASRPSGEMVAALSILIGSMFFVVLSKGFGIAYLLIFFVALISAMILVNRGLWRRFLIFASALVLAFFLNGGVRIEIADLVFSWNAENEVMQIGRRMFRIADNSIFDSSSNIAYAMFYNQSFSLAAFFYFATFIHSIYVKQCREDVAHMFILMNPCVFLVSMVIFQMVSDYGFHIASPGTDTGMSRSLITAIVLMLISGFYTLSRLRPHITNRFARERPVLSQP